MTPEPRSASTEIRLEGLSKRFGQMLAVDDVSLRIGPGEFFTFLGPSGCGKTTLLRMIAGFVQPDAGQVYLDGARVDDLPPWRREVGLVFQNFALWPHLSVFDNVAFGLRERRVPRPETRDRVQQALAMVGLEDMAQRRPSQLSGGQQQRVAVARTLVTEPRALLLDEPLSSLDARLRVQMRNELVRIQRDLGITTVYVTHDQDEALSLSTRIAVFAAGAVVQQGTPREVYEAPRQWSVADFVGVTNYLDGRVVDSEGPILSVDTLEAGVQRAVLAPGVTSPPGADTPVRLCVRPESLRIAGSDRSTTANRIDGTVIYSTYLGSVLQYDVEVAPERIFKIDVPNPRRAEVLAPGTHISLLYEPGDAVVLPLE